MKIVKLEQNYSQELNHTVDIIIKNDNEKKTLKNVQCYNQIQGVFCRCLGWSLAIHYRDHDGIMNLFFIKKESLLKKASNQMGVSEIAMKSVLWIDESGKMFE